MKKKSIKWYDRKMLALVKEIRLMETGSRCQLSGKSRHVVQLQVHHWAIGRTCRRTKYLLANNILISAVFHFMAHNEPVRFRRCMILRFGKEIVEAMEQKILDERAKGKMELLDYEKQYDKLVKVRDYLLSKRPEQRASKTLDIEVKA